MGVMALGADLKHRDTEEIESQSTASALLLVRDSGGWKIITCASLTQSAKIYSLPTKSQLLLGC
jgi:hypothetical protein